MPAVFLRPFQTACLALLLGALLAAPARAQDGEETASEAQAAPANIENRLRRIEDSLIDMRAMIGALQSFAPGDGGAPAPESPVPDSDVSDDPFAQSGDPFAAPEEPPANSGQQPSAGPGPELRQLEIQVQALAAQLSEAVQRLNRLEAALGRDDDSGMNGAAQLPPTDGDSAEAAEQEVERDREMGFGTTTVETPTVPEEDVGTWDEEAMSAPADEAGSPDAQALFAQAYDALQMQDYVAARDSFEEFLDTYPDDPLANDARYWLADAAFAEGDYVVAANNFVRVYNTAPTGEKSEETLLKLAVVLRRLDRPESACDALSRLDGRLDGMPDSFREQVAEERERSGCG